MSRRTNEHFPAVLNAVTGVGVLLISFWVELRLSVPIGIAKVFGGALVFAGMCIVFWAAIHIKEAFLGEVEPKLDVLVRDGPYKFVRHPVYLGMTVAFLGVAISLRSWPGLMGVFLLFLPGQIYRARLEEKALARKFESEWRDYAAQTGFILPLIRKGGRMRFLLPWLTRRSH